MKPLQSKVSSDGWLTVGGWGVRRHRHVILLVQVISWKISCVFVHQSTIYQSIKELQLKSSGLRVKTYFPFLSWWGGVGGGVLS